jgi:hypothetical protein
MTITLEAIPKARLHIYEVTLSDSGSIVGVRYSREIDGTDLKFALVEEMKKMLTDGKYEAYTRVKVDGKYVEGAEVEVSLRTKRTKTKRDNLDDLPTYTPSEADLSTDKTSRLQRSLAKLLTRE